MPKASFLQLISYLKQFFSDESNREKIELFIDKSVNENPWFSETLVRHAMKAIEEQFFSVQAWETFYENHPGQVATSKKVGIVLAGNLPAVGLHDVLMVLDVDSEKLNFFDNIDALYLQQLAKIAANLF